MATSDINNPQHDTLCCSHGRRGQCRYPENWNAACYLTNFPHIEAQPIEEFIEDIEGTKFDVGYLGVVMQESALDAAARCIQTPANAATIEGYFLGDLAAAKGFKHKVT